MTTKGTPSHRFKWRVSAKELRQSYEVRLAAQFGDRKAKDRLAAYNRQVKERKMEAGEIEWRVDGRLFNRYRMMEYITTRVADGESLPDVCGQAGMPSMRTVYSWFDNHPEFEREMRRCEEIRGHILGERAREIAENTDRINVNADKLKVETLSKFAARANVRFQDKQVIEKPDEFAQMTPEQLRTRINRMLEANPEIAQSVSSLLSSSQPSSQESHSLSGGLEIPIPYLVEDETQDAVDSQPIEVDPLEESQIDS